MKRKLTPRGRARRQQILDEATRLFAGRGYHPTAVADIVESLGVGKGVFYWYFESKEDLFLEILASSSQDLRRLQQAAIGDEPDPLRRIELGIRASLRWFREHRHLFNLSQFAATEERFAVVLRQNDAVAIDDISRHLKEAMADGSIPDQDPAMLAHALVGATRHLARTYLYFADEPVELVADVAVRFVLRGLAANGRGRGASP
ncbi:MAG TPA: TetR/AcrR family transcriptional regulator [Acidimicrobiia bacterium]|nr:TetR/AcrR family transcriptional regulator [Acidimicrobiia bacterium]